MARSCDGVAKVTVRCLAAGAVAMTVLSGCRLPSDRVSDAAERLTQARLESIDEVEVDADRNHVNIVLVRSASDVDAKRVWCAGVLPVGLLRDDVTVYASGMTSWWDPPSDCDDPRDVPGRRSNPASG